MNKTGIFVLDFSGCTTQTDEMEPRTNGHILQPHPLQLKAAVFKSSASISW